MKDFNKWKKICMDMYYIDTNEEDEDNWFTCCDCGEPILEEDYPELNGECPICGYRWIDDME